ncbi:MAG: hypothetical protein K0R72_793 [Clostridia bacterium]|jgi:hypothetical protein|nr:hypothetical protein [Clostridia bacterium]
MKKITVIVTMVMVLVLSLSTTAFAGSMTEKDYLSQKNHEQYTKNIGKTYGIFNAPAADVICGVYDWSNSSENKNNLTIEDSILEIVSNLEDAGYSEQANEILSADTLKQSISIADRIIKMQLTKNIENTKANNRKGWFITYFVKSAQEANYGSDVIELYIRLQLLLPVGS